MEEVDYSPGWFDIFNMSLEELLDINLDDISEEDLDPFALRLKELGKFDKAFRVYEHMLGRDMTNPCVAYYNLFEKVIIKYMDLKLYSKALLFLKSYLLYDEKERHSYRNHFILRNIGICHFNLGDEDRARQIINEVIAIAPRDYWNYYDIAFEFYRLGFTADCVFYLRLGLENAARWDEKTWCSFFEEEINSLTT